MAIVSNLLRKDAVVIPELANAMPTSQLSIGAYSQVAFKPQGEGIFCKFLKRSLAGWRILQSPTVGRSNKDSRSYLCVRVIRYG